MSGIEHPNNSSGEIRPLDVFEMDDSTLASEAARVLLGEITDGASIGLSARTIKPERAIQGALSFMLGDVPPHSFGIKRFDIGDQEEAAKKAAILTELSARIAKRSELADG